MLWFSEEQLLNYLTSMLSFERPQSVKFLKCILGIKVEASFLSDTFSVISIFSLMLFVEKE